MQQIKGNIKAQDLLRSVQSQADDAPSLAFQRQMFRCPGSLNSMCGLPYIVLLKLRTAYAHFQLFQVAECTFTSHLYLCMSKDVDCNALQANIGFDCFMPLVVVVVGSTHMHDAMSRYCLNKHAQFKYKSYMRSMVMANEDTLHRSMVSEQL